MPMVSMGALPIHHSLPLLSFWAQFSGTEFLVHSYLYLDNFSLGSPVKVIFTPRKQTSKFKLLASTLVMSLRRLSFYCLHDWHKISMHLRRTQDVLSLHLLVYSCIMSIFYQVNNIVFSFINRLLLCK